LAASSGMPLRPTRWKVWTPASKSYSAPQAAHMAQTWRIRRSLIITCARRSAAARLVHSVSAPRSDATPNVAPQHSQRVLSATTCMRRLSRMYSTIAIGTATGNVITIMDSSSGMGIRRMAE
jgi:hypothetical protein